MNDYNHNGRIDQEDWLIEEEIFQENDNNQTANTGPAFIIVAIIMISLYLSFFA